jgi:hypothetical protein
MRVMSAKITRQEVRRTTADSPRGSRVWAENLAMGSRFSIA